MSVELGRWELTSFVCPISRLHLRARFGIFRYRTHPRISKQYILDMIPLFFGFRVVLEKRRNVKPMIIEVRYKPLAQKPVEA